ncbi:TPA: ABC transporter ATP-binding protein [Streptococcus suis]|nr:ABC transporter ATP-binding protein [Streptococcus suis]
MRQLLIPRTIRQKLQFFLGIFLNILSYIIFLLIPQSIQKIIDTSQVNYTPILTIITLFCFNLFFSIISSYLLLKYAENQIFKLRKSVTTDLLKKDQSFYDSNLSGEISGHIVNDTEVIRTFLSQVFPDFVSSIFLFIISLVFLFKLDFYLSVLMLTCLLIMFIVLIPVSNFGGKFAIRKQENLSQLSGYLTEIFQRAKLIKVYKGQQYVESSLDKRLGKLVKSSFTYSLVDLIIKPVILIFIFIVICISFGYGGYRVAQSTLTAGTLISFLIYLFQLFSPLSSIAQFANQLKKMNASLTTIEQYAADISINEIDNLAIATPIESIELKGVTFDRNGKKVLNNLDMFFKKGEVTAIVGPSGSGKTTIVELISKLYTTFSGKISFNNIDLREISTDSLYSCLTYVFQGTDFFSGTIYENIVFGLDYQPTHGKVNEILEATALNVEFNDFPNGLETIIGENGIGLSGGQKQRLQIARALLRNADIYIFDEVTAHLDSVSESKIIETIRTYLNNKIVIYITHKISTIQTADKLYFLENGELTGIGTHEELKQSNLSYQQYLSKEKDNHL